MSQNRKLSDQHCYIDNDGIPHFVTAKEAQRLICSGAYPAGEYHGRPCIVSPSADVRELRKLTPRVQGEKLGFAGMQLVAK